METIHVENIINDPTGKKNLLAHSFYRKSDTKVKLKIWY